ncbi:MAG: indole-3-glycerol phosphate synthase TrpC [Planctomycetaceae bacterium]|jgi:indole-3-glycerol phosphate synthase|nr:indole-3-glycerol phosphate synthase TrpC [Planctomycetaceae bacterium]
MTDILNEIVRLRRRDYEGLSFDFYGDFSGKISERLVRPFRAALSGQARGWGEVAIIAEIKRGSPSKGIFAPKLDPVVCAVEYESGGAAALSVLTEGRYFGGLLEDLIAVRANCSLPILRKDFVVTEYQVYETAIYADCMLLIARTLDAKTIKDYHDLATELKLDVLVEVYDESDIEKISPFNFPLIGINHRNLATMEIDIGSSGKFAGCFNKDQTIVAASGIHSRSDIEKVMNNGSGISAFLIGESLSKSKDRIKFLRGLVGKH